MAEKKTSSKSKAQTNAELAEQLRLAAEILDGASGASEKPAEKNTAAKKPTAKKPASKTPAKKPTTKKSATKAAPKKAENPPVEEEPPVAEEPETPAVEQPTEAPVVEQPTEQPAQPAAEAQAEPAQQKRFGNRRSDCVNCGAENDKNAVVCAVCGAKLRPLPNAQSQEQAQPGVAEKPVAEQPAPAVEEKAEEKAEQPTEPVDKKAEQPAPAPQARGKKSDAFMSKSNEFIKKWGLPLFIIANSLLLLSSIFLMIGAFDFSVSDGTTRWASVFNYFTNENAILIKRYWVTAGSWVNGGYVMVGILMLLAFLVPLALIVKNAVLFILKKDKNVHMLDAIITFAFLIAYLGVVNMYGANMTWAHVLSLIISVILLAYTIFVILIENREGPFPFFSIANLVMVMLCMFLLTSNKIYDAPRQYAATAAGESGAGGFAFIMLLIDLAALVLLIVMQVKKLPGKIAWLFEFLVPAVIGVCALIALISFAVGKPSGLSMGGGFVFGGILTMLFAITDIVFALVPQLHKFNVKVTDRMSATQPAPAVQPVAQPAAQDAPATESATSEQPAAESATSEQPAAESATSTQPAPATETAPEKPAAEAPVVENGGNTYCPACGTKNGADDMYCMRCGRKLK